MSKIPKLAIFDVDGTIANHGVVSPMVVSGIKHLHAKNCITTVSTGRGYIRLKETLGEAFDTIISPNALLILEHGTKITSRDGEVKFGEFFSSAEINHIIDFTRENIGLFKLLWFNPVRANDKVQVWCANPKDLAIETEKRGHYANVFTSSLGELETIMLGQKLTNVTLKLKDYVKVENLKLAFTRTATNVIFQDGNMEFVKNNINKGLSVRWVAKHLDVEASDILIAGNAINDIEMLDASYFGTTILVSSGDNRANILPYLPNPDDIIIVDAPDKLGEYLLEIN